MAIRDGGENKSTYFVYQCNNKRDRAQLADVSEGNLIRLLYNPCVLHGLTKAIIRILSLQNTVVLS